MYRAAAAEAAAAGRNPLLFPARLNTSAPRLSCRAATMGKQATFNMIAGAAIVAAPMAHMMSRYYCTIRPSFPPARPRPCAPRVGLAGPRAQNSLRERERELRRWQRSTPLPAKQDSEPFVLCVLGAVLPLVSHPLVLSLAPSPRWRAPANTWKDGKLTSSPSEWFSKYQGLSSASRAQN